RRPRRGDENEEPEQKAQHERGPTRGQAESDPQRIGDQHGDTARDSGRQHRLGLQELFYLDLLHGLPPPARVPMFHGWRWPATATPRSSLMSPDEAPASTTTGPFSTAQWCASA